VNNKVMTIMTIMTIIIIWMEIKLIQLKN